MKTAVSHDPNYNHRQIGFIAEQVADVELACSVYEDEMRTPKSFARFSASSGKSTGSRCGALASRPRLLSAGEAIRREHNPIRLSGGFSNKPSRRAPRLD